MLFFNLILKTVSIKTCGFCLEIQKFGIPAKLIVCGMTTNSLNLVDPDDGGMLEVCGFDSHTANVICDFITGVI